MRCNIFETYIRFNNLKCLVSTISSVIIRLQEEDVSKTNSVLWQQVRNFARKRRESDHARRRKFPARSYLNDFKTRPGSASFTFLLTQHLHVAGCFL